MTFDDIPLTILEQEVFCECGSWKNFEDLETSLSLDELIVLYEATIERQQRLLMAVASSMGADIDIPDDSDKYIYSDSESNSESSKADKNYVPMYAMDQQRGGEVEPVFGEHQIQQLPINLGYSIIE